MVIRIRWKLLIISLLLGLYVLGYIRARMNQSIVHSVVRDHAGNIHEHSVVSGDGIFLGGMIKTVSAAIYTPLRFIETQYWYWQQPTVGTHSWLCKKIAQP
jgi:hypothetical protein